MYIILECWDRSFNLEVTILLSVSKLTIINLNSNVLYINLSEYSAGTIQNVQIKHI